MRVRLRHFSSSKKSCCRRTMGPSNKTIDSVVRGAVGMDSGPSSVTEVLSNVLPQTISGLNTTLTALSRDFGNLVSTTQLQADALTANTQALVQETTTRQSGSVAGMLGSAASSLLGGGIGFSPIISGLLDLFGGSNATSPPPLVPFSLPPSLAFQAANASPSNGLGMPGADYSQSGIPRSMQEQSAGASSTQAKASPQITINVQAMDSRSFSDHSSDIANAVREAMLNMHSLNDVISDL